MTQAGAQRNAERYYSSYQALKPVMVAIDDRTPQLLLFFLSGIETAHGRWCTSDQAGVTILPIRHWNRTMVNKYGRVYHGYYSSYQALKPDRDGKVVGIEDAVTILPIRHWNLYRLSVEYLHQAAVTILPIRHWNLPQSISVSQDEQGYYSSYQALTRLQYSL